MAVIPSSVIEYIHETDLPTPPPTSLPQSTVPIATVTMATVGTASPSSQRPKSSASQSVSLISTAPPAQGSGGDNQSSLLYTPGECFHKIPRSDQMKFNAILNRIGFKLLLTTILIGVVDYNSNIHSNTF